MLEPDTNLSKILSYATDPVASVLLKIRVLIFASIKLDALLLFQLPAVLVDADQFHLP